jgi:ubiquinone/menaquinone biosynthesis C-methylase UbiE
MLEHLETPEKALREFSRVLKKGGFLYIKTSNLQNYAMMVSWATPTAFHHFFRSAAGHHKNTPTFYRANTKRKLTELAVNSGFSVRRLESYSYSFMYYTFNKELFLLMRAISKLVGKVTDGMRLMLCCVLEKTEDPQSDDSAVVVEGR